MSALASWRHGAWRVGAWRTGSWRGMGPNRSVDVAFFEYRRHPGWNRNRNTLRLSREHAFDRSVREIYRQVLGIPETAARAAEIMAPYERYVEGARARQLELASLTAEAEIALRMLHEDLQAIQDAKDEAAIMALLPKVL